MSSFVNVIVKYLNNMDSPIPTLEIIWVRMVSCFVKIPVYIPYPYDLIYRPSDGPVAWRTCMQP